MLLVWFKTVLAQRALARATALRLAGQWRAAQTEFRQALAHASAAAPDNTTMRQIASAAALGLGRVQLCLGEAAAAVEHFELACQLQPAAWEPFYYRGCAAGWQQDFDQAEASFTEALTRNPTNPQLHLQRGHARFSAGRLTEALTDYLAAQKAGALSERDYLALAALRLQRGEHAEAEQVLRALVTRGCAEALLSLGAALEGQNKLSEAAAVYEQAAERKEDLAGACLRLGVVNTQLQRYEEAVTWLERARRAGETETALFYYGWACCQLRRYDACLEAWQLLKQRQPQQARLRALLQKVSYLWGRDLVKAGAYAAALPLWREYYSGRENDRQLAQALAELHLRAAAQALQQRGLDALDEAATQLAEACELAPDEGRFLLGLALTALLARDFTRGRELLEEAVALAPHDPRARYYLALSLWWEFDEEQAEAILREVGAQAVSADWRQRALGSLGAIYVEQGRWSDAANALLSGEAA